MLLFIVSSFSGKNVRPDKCPAIARKYQIKHLRRAVTFGDTQLALIFSVSLPGVCDEMYRYGTAQGNKADLFPFSKTTWLKSLFVIEEPYWFKDTCSVVAFGLISVTRWRSRRFNLQYFPAMYAGLRLNSETYFFYIAPCNGLQGDVAQYAANQTRNTGANPFSFW